LTATLVRRGKRTDCGKDNCQGKKGKPGSTSPRGEREDSGKEKGREGIKRAGDLLRHGLRKRGRKDSKGKGEGSQPLHYVKEKGADTVFLKKKEERSQRSKKGEKESSNKKKGRRVRHGAKKGGWKHS